MIIPARKNRAVIFIFEIVLPHNLAMTPYDKLCLRGTVTFSGKNPLSRKAFSPLLQAKHLKALMCLKASIFLVDSRTILPDKL